MPPTAPSSAYFMECGAVRLAARPAPRQSPGPVRHACLAWGVAGPLFGVATVLSASRRGGGVAPMSFVIPVGFLLAARVIRGGVDRPSTLAGTAAGAGVGVNGPSHWPRRHPQLHGPREHSGCDRRYRSRANWGFVHRAENLLAWPDPDRRSARVRSDRRCSCGREGHHPGGGSSRSGASSARASVVRWSYRSSRGSRV
jgi:hypothetical protein